MHGLVLWRDFKTPIPIPIPHARRPPTASEQPSETVPRRAPQFPPAQHAARVTCSKTPTKAAGQRASGPRGTQAHAHTPARACMLQRQARNTQLGAGTTAARSGLRAKRNRAPRGLDLQRLYRGATLPATTERCAGCTAAHQLHAAVEEEDSARHRSPTRPRSPPRATDGRAGQGSATGAPGHKGAHKTPGHPLLAGSLAAA
jgi:hypothetical protein